MIKQLRKFSNMTVSCLTANDKLQKELSDILKDVKELECFDTPDSMGDIKSDIIVIDYRIKDAQSVIENIAQTYPLLPKIVIMDDTKEKDIVVCLNSTVVSIIKYPINNDDLKLAILVALNRSKRADKVFLNNGYYYDAYRERFYNEDGQVQFTNFEFGVLKLLVDNPTRIINYDEIKEKVWKEKKMSIFTMRNVINKIRKKTYKGIIKNNSSKGYQIDSAKK